MFSPQYYIMTIYPSVFSMRSSLASSSFWYSKTFRMLSFSSSTLLWLSTARIQNPKPVAIRKPPVKDRKRESNDGCSFLTLLSVAAFAAAALSALSLSAFFAASSEDKPASGAAAAAAKERTWVWSLVLLTRESDKAVFREFVSNEECEEISAGETMLLPCLNAAAENGPQRRAGPQRRNDAMNILGDGSNIVYYKKNTVQFLKIPLTYRNIEFCCIIGTIFLLLNDFWIYCEC